LVDVHDHAFMGRAQARPPTRELGGAARRE
jgi:hypothetical protein